MGAAVVVGWVAAACSGGDAAHLGSGRECSSIQGPLQGQNLREMYAVLFFKESLILYGPYTLRNYMPRYEARYAYSPYTQKSS